MPEDDKTSVVKAVAEFEAASAVELRSKLRDEQYAAFRWIVASLFALNGGAILTIFWKNELEIREVFPAFCIFLLGVISIFSSVIFAHKADRKMICGIHDKGAYWATVVATGIEETEIKIEIEKGIQEADNIGRRANIFAFFAMVLFILGVLNVVIFKLKSEIAQIETELEKIEANLDNAGTVPAER